MLRSPHPCLVLLALLLIADATRAQDPGALLITRSESNDVVDISAGGDFSAAVAFATGLSGPFGLCRRPDGRILVSERSSDEVTDITGGGDFSLAPAFASGLEGPVHLLCTETRVLVAVDSGVMEITAGGDFSGATPFAFGLPDGMGILEDTNGNLWFGTPGGEIFDITAGGNFSGVAPFATLDESGGLAEFDSRLLVANGVGESVTDFSNGGDVGSGFEFATGLAAVGGLFADAARGELYASTFDGAVFEVSSGGDFAAASPFAFGLGAMLPAQLVRVPGCGDGIVQMNESCDDGNGASGDGCGRSCLLECFTDPIPEGCEPAAPGDLLATASGEDAIYEISSGGDYAHARPFAAGVGDGGLCATPEGQLLATGDGRVVDITRGGDFDAAPAYATGLDNTLRLACGDGEVLVTDGNDELFDITGGGDFASATPFAHFGTLITGVFRASDGTLWVSTDFDIFDATAGGDFTQALPFASGGLGLSALTGFRGRLLVADVGRRTVLDFTAGGDLAAAPVFAEVNSPGGLRGFDGIDQLFAADISNPPSEGYHEISAGGDFRSSLPFASGLDLNFFEDLARVPGCGDGIVVEPEVCDDGNTDDGDGCNASCQLACTAAPRLGCVEAAKGSLLVNENKAGKEKWKASLQKLGDPTTQGDLGDPVTGTTRFDLCLYDGAGALVGSAVVDRPGDTCGAKAKGCWKAQSTRGWKYKDPDAESGGIKKIQLKAGDPGKGKVAFDGGNNTKKGQMSLETGVAAQLAGSTGATVQVIASDGICTTLEADTVKKDTGTQFKALRR